MSLITNIALMSSCLSVALTPAGRETLKRADYLNLDGSNLTYDYNGEHLLALAKDREPAIWNARTGELVWRLVGHTEPVRRVEFSRDGKLALTSSFIPPGATYIPSTDNSIRVWEISTGKQLLQIRDATYGQFSRDGKKIFGLTDRKKGINFDLASWDVKSGRIRFKATLPHDGIFPYEQPFTLQECAQSPNLLVVKDFWAQVYDCNSGKPLTDTIRPRSGGNFGFLSTSGDEIHFDTHTHIISYSITKKAEITNVPYPKKGHVFPETSWSNDGNKLVSVGFTGDIFTFDNTKKELITIHNPYIRPRYVVMSPNGKTFLISFYSDETKMSACYTANPCEVLWTKPGQVIGFANDEEALVIRGADLFRIKVATGTERLLCKLEAFAR